MDRSLYSLILMDDVVAEIDRIAARTGMSRSGLVNQILADYASLMTPEKRIDGIFREIESLLAAESELVPFVTAGRPTMSVKSSLEYKYRPTIKYEVELYRVPNGAVGKLTVAFRTQSAALLASMTHFFRLWKKLEDVYISKLYPENAIQYELYDGRFTRTIALPRSKDYTSAQLSTAITEYVKMFDTLLKGCLTGNLSPAQLEDEYLSYLNRGVGLI